MCTAYTPNVRVQNVKIVKCYIVLKKVVYLRAYAVKNVPTLMKFTLYRF